MKKHLVLTTFVMICMIATLVMGMSAPFRADAAPLAQDPPPPTIQGNKLDYAPGELVTLTGGNWQGDTQVRIFINDDLGQTWSRDVTSNPQVARSNRSRRALPFSNAAFLELT